MKRSRFSGEQIIAVLKEQEAGMPTAEVCRRHGISSATFYKWKSHPLTFDLGTLPTQPSSRAACRRSRCGDRRLQPGC